MAGRLQGKVAIITGGASGIGAATSRLFVQEGANVVVADRHEPNDEALVAVMRDKPDRVIFCQTDVTSETQVQAAISAAVSTWGRLDTAVACAGIDGAGASTDLTEAQWDHVMAVNAKGVFFVAKHAIPHMLDAGGGSIVNISSTYGITGAPGFAGYCASKGAVRTFTKSVALEHVDKGIRVNSVHPGVIQTPLLQSVFDRTDDPAATRDIFAAQQPGGVIGRPEDIGWACVYLASDEARYVTGIEMPVDGGLLAR